MNLTTYKQYKSAEVYLESLNNLPKGDVHGGTDHPEKKLLRMKFLLKLAGNPDKAYKIIHIAGTSGKGTVASHLSNILVESGHNVGLHISPFVSIPLEKIQVNNKFIQAREFILLVEQIKPLIEQCYLEYDMPNLFEAWLLLALLYFKQKNCDYIVLEAGCGGKNDASNAVANTLISIITNVGLDHTHILGDTLTKIAREKACIIRKNGKVFTAADRKSALSIIKKICVKQKADLTIIKNAAKTDDINNLLARTAALELSIPRQLIDNGINKSKLPCRYEIIRQNPTIIMDGAHNPDKLKFLARKLAKEKYNKLHLICALAYPRNPQKCFKPLIKLADNIYCTRFLTPFRKSISPLRLANQFAKTSSKQTIMAFINPEEALNSALKKAKNNDIVLITGSFFLCGDLRKKWISEEKQLEQRTNFLK